jgi:plastocyanin
VVAGLAAGVALIAAFSVLGASPSFQTRYAHQDVSFVIIPAGSSDQNSHKNFEPALITVVIGQNNTVKWVNKDDVPSAVRANDKSDPNFFAASHNNGTVLTPNATFEFTFTKPGRFDYHSEPHPWLHGTIIVVVLPPR